MDMGADPNAQTTAEPFAAGYTCLMIAVMARNAELSRMFLQCPQIDIAIQDDNR